MGGSQARYTNFRDPVGLMLRILRSGDRAGRSALSRAAAERALVPLDIALQPVEHRKLRTYGADPDGVHEQDLSSRPILLIVGLPRSGTTLLYQVLSRYLRVSYFTNLSALFPRSPMSATELFSSLLRHRRVDFHNYYGNTAGMAGVNDGFHIWNRWLGTDRYRTPQELDDAASARMRAFFDAWRTVFPQPLLNKNNRNMDCIPLLASVLEDAFFIVVNRNPLHVVQSLIAARLEIQGDKGIGWGLRSRDQTPGSDRLSYVDDVCDQVCGMEVQLQEDRRRVGRERFIDVSFERFCADPCNAVRAVATITGVKLDERAMQRELRPFIAHAGVFVAREEFERITWRMEQTFGVMEEGRQVEAR